LPTGDTRWTLDLRGLAWRCAADPFQPTPGGARGRGLLAGTALVRPVAGNRVGATGASPTSVNLLGVPARLLGGGSPPSRAPTSTFAPEYPQTGSSGPPAKGPTASQEAGKGGHWIKGSASTPSKKLDYKRELTELYGLPVGPCDRRRSRARVPDGRWDGRSEHFPELPRGRGCPLRRLLRSEVRDEARRRRDRLRE